MIHNIFKPDLMFTDHIRGSWCKNIDTISGKLPINSYLRSNGIFALDIKPNQKDDWYAFGIPFNKNWDAMNIKKNSKLYFHIYIEDSIHFTVKFETQKIQTNPIPFKLKETNGWKEIVVEVPAGMVRMFIISGSSYTKNYAIKDIVLEMPDE